METVFKVGMKVYDQLMYPDTEGIVTDTNFIPEKSFFDKEEDYEEGYEHPYPIEVDFKGEQALYKNDGSGFMDFPTLSTKPYEVEFKGFEQKAPTPTYEEIVKGKNYIYLPENLVAPNKELADAVVALLKLLFLRDYYNEGWQADWKNNKQTKYTIEFYIDELWCESYTTNKKILSFKNDKIRDIFFEEQKELLEIAKPLL